MMRNGCRFYFFLEGWGGRNLEERNNLPDLHAYGSITQKCVSNKLVDGVDRLHLVQDKCKVMDCFKNSNEPSGSLKCPEILS